MDTLGSRLRYARTAKGFSQDFVARHFGINRVSVTQWESDTTAPERDKIPDLAKLLETNMDWLISNVGDPPPVKSDLVPAVGGTGIRTSVTPGSKLVGNPNLPVFAAAQGGDDGYLIVTFDPIDYVKRPAILENVKGGYGLLIRGVSMVPAYRDGDMGLVHPHLQPQAETDVVLYGKVPEDEPEVKAIVKQLDRWTDDWWTLEQFNPPKVFKVSRPEWPVCHRIVGKYSRR